MIIETKIHNLNAVISIPATPDTSKRCAIFCPGLGETGTDILKLYAVGMGKFLKDGTLKPSCVCICFQPSPKNTWPNAIMMDWILDYAVTNYQIEKFSLTGLSAGAAGCYKEMAGGKHWAKVDRIVAFSMDMNTPAEWKAERYVNVKFWGICGSTDSRGPKLKAFVADLKARGFDAKYTQYTGGHCCWNTYYNPTWKDTDGETVYSWLNVLGAVPVFKNAEVSKAFTRNNCLTGYKGSAVIYTVLAGTYTAATQTEADAKALADVNTNGQTYANTNGSCTPIPVGSVLIKPDPQGNVYLTDLTSLGIKPGTNVILKGNYNTISMGLKKGFAGDPDARILIINDGKVNVKDYIRFYNMLQFLMTGSGSNDKYGITCATLAISNGTSDYEVERIEAANQKKGTGFWFKINQVITDPKTLYGGWWIKNVSVHDNWVHDTNSEGMYIGHTDPSGAQYSNGIAPVQMQNVKVYRNLVERTGWDGIQVSNSREGTEIYENEVTDYGLALAGSQQNGIIMGANSTGFIRNNTIISADGAGKGAIACFGYGDVAIEDNILDNPHPSTNTGDNIYINDPLLSNNPSVPPVNINPGLRVAVRRNIIKGSTATTSIRSANYHKTQLPGIMEENTVETFTNRTEAQLVYSGAGDVIKNNTINHL